MAFQKTKKNWKRGRELTLFFKKKVSLNIWPPDYFVWICCLCWISNQSNTMSPIQWYYHLSRVLSDSANLFTKYYANFKYALIQNILADDSRIDIAVGNKDTSATLEIAIVVKCCPGVGLAGRIGPAGGLAIVAVRGPDPSDVISLDVIVVVKLPAPLETSTQFSLIMLLSEFSCLAPRLWYHSQCLDSNS